MNWLRTWLFKIIFYGVSTPIVLCAPIAALFGRPALIGYSLAWARFHRWTAVNIMGVRSRIEGERPRPTLYAAKHQAMYETIELTLLLDAPAIVMKQELARIPVWGWVARRYGVIVIDRAGSATALRQIMREGKAALAAGRSILIFPEGTRVAPGQQPPLLSGFAGLYRALKLPVIPVALDSGRFWPRHGIGRPGIVTFRFCEPIAPGMPRTEVEAIVHRVMNQLDVPAAE
ncbi:lysophospholipid acyltransferase family protein [Sphingomonas sp. AR_OL41]|uniref:lysophospholipid acyltransferase family protein n=1 Tax=Sphingomonas sp. AR_OL41 TaxID=3042729 RepID=UPI0024814C88|nr:lysophospholipid acyltransferase family protein [Sphingomonas sp. AR_OL41]MDH7973858.1 lysophospholipid acyltransferase family protein [Sphingomonas sp. AR_OL41]